MGSENLTEGNPEPKVYARRLVRGSAVVFAALVASGLVAFLLRMFLARSFSVEEYGFFYTGIALVSFFGLFRGLGLGSALVKHIPEFKLRGQFGEIKSSMTFAVLFQAVFAFLIAALLFLFSDRIVPAFSSPADLAVVGAGRASLVIKILSIWFFVALFPTTLKAAFQGFQDMPAYASMSFFEIFFVLLSAILLVGLFGIGVEGAAYAYLLASSAVAVLGFLLFQRRYPRVLGERARITKTLVKKLFAFALPVFIGGLGGLIIGYTDTLMIAGFWSSRQVGFYQAAQPAARILWYLVTPLVTVLFPMISELWARRERKLLGGALHFLTKFSFILIIPPALVFIAFPEIVIRLLFGSEYLPGTTALRILAGAAIVYGVYAILASTINGIGKPIINTKVVGVMACLNLAGNLALIPAYGIEGAATATFSAYALGLVLMFYYARKFIKFSVPVLSLLKTVAGGILTLLIIFGLKSVLALPPWPEAFAVVIPSLMFYGVWVLATKAVTKDDLRLIARIVPMPGWLVRTAGRFVGK